MRPGFLAREETLKPIKSRNLEHGASLFVVNEILGGVPANQGGDHTKERGSMLAGIRGTN